MAPIGTKYTPAQPLTEQRGEGTYHQRMPWPEEDDTRLQAALLERPQARRQRRMDIITAITCTAAVLGAAALAVFAR